MPTRPLTSPFLTPAPRTGPDSLAILHLRRDSLVPTVLQEIDTKGSGYAEGCVANTRFGSFPHSTLLNKPWGSQVLASQVDTGSRGRPKAQGQGQKRKRQEQEDTDADADADTSGRQKQQQKEAVRASSGFCHVIPPTPEAWTQSLPHRTQVVYTPDYSFIVQKLRIRPGSTVIEAGAGSGSFTHAAARAAFNGYSSSLPSSTSAAVATGEATDKLPSPPARGHVFSFEYHAPRAATLQTELAAHGLTDTVTLTHRDVYADGFALRHRPVAAQHIFLDLPAPWTALHHLSRSTPNSPLDSSRPSHLCAFLPCIEQAQRMAAALRTAGWTELTMAELAHRRLEVRRDRIGLRYEGLRGVSASAASVSESLARLRTVEERARDRAAIQRGRNAENNTLSNKPDTNDTNDDIDDIDDTATAPAPATAAAAAGTPSENKTARRERLAREAARTKPWEEGRLVLRTEPELKSHTSYLVFAVLPRAWGAEDEARAARKWGRGSFAVGKDEGRRGKKGRR